MKPTDIRINNWVLYDGLPNKILSIIFPQPTDDRFNGEWVVEINPPDSFNVLLSELEPVPLTGEWMERLGFQKDKNKKLRRHSVFYTMWFFDYAYSFSYAEFRGDWGFYHSYTDAPDPKEDYRYDFISCGIQHVHQLQQLFHALTQQELT
jgi:hypothetical protein